MCKEVNVIQTVAELLQKNELHELDTLLTKEDKINLVNSLATLNVVGDHFIKGLNKVA